MTKKRKLVKNPKKLKGGTTLAPLDPSSPEYKVHREAREESPLLDSFGDDLDRIRPPFPGDSSS